MHDYFGEKSRQIEPGIFDAFGIQIHSRHGRAGEIVEMIDFAKRAAASGLAHYVKEMNYDSKAGFCTFELAETVQEGDFVANALYEIAENTISCFSWYDVACYSHQFSQEWSVEAKARAKIKASAK